MKNTIFAAAALLSLASCQTTTEAMLDPEAQRLASQADLAAVIGKTITFNPGQSFEISSNGKMRGIWDGKPLVGTYVMRDGFFCRTLTEGPRGPSPEDCQVWMLDGNTLSATRDKGEGSSFDYVLS